MHFLGQLPSQSSFSSNYLHANALLYKHFILGLGMAGKNLPVFNLGYRTKDFAFLAGYSIQTNVASKYSQRSFQIQLSNNLRKKDQTQTINSFETW